MSIEVAVDDSGPVPRLVSFMFRRMDMSDGGQQRGQHEREGANNHGGRTHDVSIARSPLIVNQLTHASDAGFTDCLVQRLSFGHKRASLCHQHQPVLHGDAEESDQAHQRGNVPRLTGQ